MQAEWEARLGEVEAAAEQRVHHERGLSQARLDEAQQCAEREAAAAADLSKQLDTLQQQHASLADDHSASVAEVAALRVSARAASRPPWKHPHLSCQSIYA